MKKILIVLLVIIVLGAGAFLLRDKIIQTDTIPVDWQVYTGDGVQFSYPKTFGLTVWKAVTRPPIITIVPTDKDPIAIGCPSAQVGTTTEGKIKGFTYTLLTGEDIGAGSRYSRYCYVFEGKDINYVLDFEIHSHSGCENGQCGAYCGTEFEQECSGFDMMKDVIQPIEKMVSTVRILK